MQRVPKTNKRAKKTEYHSFLSVHGLIEINGILKSIINTFICLVIKLNSNKIMTTTKNIRAGNHEERGEINAVNENLQKCIAS